VSRYNVDRSSEFIPGYKIGSGYWRSVAVQTISEPEICQGAECLLGAAARVRVHEALQNCLGGRSKSKNHDKLIYLPSVLWARPFLFVWLPESCQGIQILFLFFVSPVAEIILRRREGEKF
jgi:hypothetical protein